MIIGILRRALLFSITVFLVFSSFLLSTENQSRFFIINGDKGSGSGFTVNLEGKIYLCTNLHVVVGQKQFIAKTLNGKEIKLGETTLVPDDERDVVLFEVIGYEDAFEITDGNFKHGQTVTSWGNSAGQNLITKKEGEIVGIGQTEIEYTNPTVMGDSGSAVINHEGYVVAVVTRGLKQQRMNAWLEDRPEMHTRRFGTRIDGVKWIKTSRKQILRIAELYNYIMEFNSRWISEYNSAFANKNPLEKTSDYQRFMWSKYKDRSFDDEWRSFLKPRENVSITPQLLSPVNCWKADLLTYPLFALDFQITENLTSMDLLKRIFFNHLLDNLKLCRSMIKEMPSSWITKELNSEIDFVSRAVEKYFPRFDEDYFEIFDFLGKRNLLYYDNKSIRFAGCLSSAEILFAVYERCKNHKQSTFIKTQQFYKILYLSENITNHDKDPWARDFKLTLRNFSLSKLDFAVNSSMSRKWIFDDKLDAAIERSKNKPDFAFLSRFALSDRAYVYFKTFEKIKSQINNCFAKMNSNFYDQSLYDKHITEIINLSSLFYSSEEKKLFSSLK